MTWGSESARLLGAAIVVALYSALCLAVWQAQLRKRRHALLAATALAPSMDAGPTWLVAYASQTGTAEELAWQTARALHAGGMSARVSALADVDLQTLQATDNALMVVSTYGEGDPPDNAAAFARLMAEHREGPALPKLRCAVLALGDSEYKNFCGFGRSLDAWLQAHGAQALFDRVDVDNNASDALARWQSELENVGGAADAADWLGPAFENWRLRSRRQLNPGTVGGPTFEVELEPLSGEPDWEAGDLVQLLAPADPGRAREYSIASLPVEGAMRLLVRQERHPDGSLGVASGYLTQQAEPGALLQLRLRPNKNFHGGENASRPMILIGNGTGLAGLRAHLKARMASSGVAASRNWLLFGERNVECDFYWRNEIDEWRKRGLIERLDLAFSRDQPTRVYVQDRLRESREMLRRWLDDGAAIYVCGSLQGMAAGVHAVLVDVIGSEAVDELARSGRYRRDVY